MLGGASATLALLVLRWRGCGALVDGNSYWLDAPTEQYFQLRQAMCGAERTPALKTDDGALALPLASTPPLGWNSWNAYHDTSADILKRAARDMVSFGLRDAGYKFVNSDDVWMLPTINRSDGGRGPQAPDPVRFPDGFKPVVDYIHSLNLSVGIYTARANQTCSGRAGSCMHEDVDAAQYAEWEIDYVKDDSCGSCRGDDDASILRDYQAMSDAIKKTGRPMVLSIEGMPPIRNCSKGGYGNLRRVGVDISPSWTSMTALIDAGSGLWPFAHNGSATGQGFWNDIDLLEVGNGDFAPVNSTFPAGALDAARAHFSMWALLKAPLLVSTNLSAASTETLNVLKNNYVLMINQDPLGIQGRRVSSVPPPANAASTTAASCNASTASTLQCDNLALVKTCNKSDPLQHWRYESGSGLTTLGLFITPCNSSELAQRWVAPIGSPGVLRQAVGAKPLCARSTSPVPNIPSSPVPLGSCNDTTAQNWTWRHDSASPSGLGHIVSDGNCLSIPRMTGPEVVLSGCGTAGTFGDSLDLFQLHPDGLIELATLEYLVTGPRVVPGSGMCLTSMQGSPGGRIVTSDSSGQKWCLSGQGPAGSVKGLPCDSLDETNVESSIQSQWQLWENVSSTGGFISAGMAKLTPQTHPTIGSSGPLPHTRYIGATTPLMVPWSFSSWVWTAPGQDDGGMIRLPPGQKVDDNDNVGTVRSMDSGKLCLTLGPSGNLEVWTAPLSDGKFAVVLFNRSPVAAAISARWEDIGAAAQQKLDIFDVWRAEHHASVSHSWTDPLVPSRGCTLLIMTPATS